MNLECTKRNLHYHQGLTNLKGQFHKKIMGYFTLAEEELAKIISCAWEESKKA
jgi:hypothetical protein